MTPDELKEAYSKNLKARTLMEGMAVINPMLGLAGIGATKYAESQIIKNMKDKGVDIPDPEEEGGIIAGITNWFSETFGTKKDKEPVVTPKSSVSSAIIQNNDDTPVAPSVGSSTGESTAATRASAMSAARQAGTPANVAASLSGSQMEAGTEVGTGEGGTDKSGPMNKGGLMQKKKKK